MNILKKMGFFHICPACQADFSHFIVVKKLLFCPYCQQGLKAIPKRNRYISEDWRFFKRLTASAIVAIILIIFFLNRKYIYFNGIDILFKGCAFFMIFLAFVYGAIFVWGRGRLRISVTIACHVDRLDVVQQERCPEYKIYMQSASGDVKCVSCPVCQSMRLADRYWYKISWLEKIHQMAALPDVQDPKFYGCLNCGKIFEQVKSKQKLWRDYLKFSAGLIFWFFVALGLIFLHHKGFVTESIIQIPVIFLGFTSYAMLLIFPSRHSHNIYADNILKEVGG